MAEVCDACEASGMAANAWLVLLHNTRLGEAHPEATVENAFGDRYVYSLCPAAPAARRYAVALCADLSDHYPVRGISLETPGFLPYAHGFHHEFALVGRTNGSTAGSDSASASTASPGPGRRASTPRGCGTRSASASNATSRARSTSPTTWRRRSGLRTSCSTPTSRAFSAGGARVVSSLVAESPRRRPRRCNGRGHPPPSPGRPAERGTRGATSRRSPARPASSRSASTSPARTGSPPTCGTSGAAWEKRGSCAASCAPAIPTSRAARPSPTRSRRSTRAASRTSPSTPTATCAGPTSTGWARPLAALEGMSMADFEGKVVLVTGAAGGHRPGALPALRIPRRGPSRRWIGDPRWSASRTSFPPAASRRREPSRTSR